MAFWRGGPPERWGAAILLSGWFITPLVDSHDTVRLGILIVDIVALIGFVWLSLWSRRVWTLFAAAFQLEAVASHIAVSMMPQIGSFSYVTGLGIWGGYGLVAALAAGVWSHVRRQKAQAVPKTT